MTKNIIFITIVGFILTSCFTHIRQVQSNYPGRNASDTKIYPRSLYADSNISKQFLTQANGAKECSNPEVSVFTISKGFRYGCFCGSLYPEIEHQSGKLLNELTDLERLELAQTYYAIRPIDQIDGACLRHDVCVIMSGKQTIECNDQFQNEINKMNDIFFEEIEHKNATINLSHRCWLLTNDISVAFNTPVPEGKSDDNSDERIDAFSRWGATVLVGWAYAIWRVGLAELAGFKYPMEAEKCFTAY